MQQTGADGLRLDSPRLVETSWISDLRSRVKTEIEPLRARHVFVVGDTFTGDPAVMNSLVNPDTLLDGQFEYPLRAQVVTNVLLRQGSMSELEARITADENTFSGGLSTFVGNHVVPRSIHFAEDVPLWTSAWADGRRRSAAVPRFVLGAGREGLVPLRGAALRRGRGRGPPEACCCHDGAATGPAQAYILVVGAGRLCDGRPGSSL